MKCPFKFIGSSCELDEYCSHDCMWRVEVKKGGETKGYTCAIASSFIEQAQHHVTTETTFAVKLDMEEPCK